MFFKPKPWRMFLVLFAILAFTMPVYAQGGFVFDGKRTQETLAFKKSRGLIILPIYINQKGPFNFILDTGVGPLIITDTILKDSLKLKYLRKIAIDGLGEKDKLIGYSTPFLELKIGNAVYKGASGVILASDVFDLSAYLGMPIHGLIGYDFFNSFVVKINYEADFLKIFTTRNARLFKNGTKIPIEIIEKKPFIEGTVETDQGIKLLLKLLVDTGNGHPLSLESFENKPFVLPNNFVVANLGVGLNGNIRGVDGRIKKLNIGKFTFNDVVTSFPYFEDVGAKVGTYSRNGSIGNPLLSKFNVVFDYKKNHIFLKHLNSYKKPFLYDKSGLELVTGGQNFDRFLVNRVEPGSAADEFGIMAGDELLAINFVKVSTMTMGEIIKILSSDNGRTLFVEIARGDDLIAGILKLKKRI
nr:aspartyl protease family protein [uncultured Pedobacter sp.]